MKQTIDSKLKNAMTQIIERFKQTSDGFCCLETDYLGMNNFLERKANEPKSDEWQTAFNAVAPEIAFVQVYVKNMPQEMAEAAWIA